MLLDQIWSNVYCKRRENNSTTESKGTKKRITCANRKKIVQLCNKEEENHEEDH
jgi:hypothetical protein